MNDNSIVTITVGDQAENHAGMEKLGELVEKGDGFNLEDLHNVDISKKIRCLDMSSIKQPIFNI